MTRFGMSAYTALTVFGTLVAATMFLIYRWHQRNLGTHKREVEKLLAIARAECH